MGLSDVEDEDSFLSKRRDTPSDTASQPRISELLYCLSITETEVIILIKEIISVYSENNTKLINTLWVKIFFLMLGGRTTYSNQYACKS